MPWIRYFDCYVITEGCLAGQIGRRPEGVKKCRWQRQCGIRNDSNAEGPEGRGTKDEG